jgi:hypothetical protein
MLENDVAVSRLPPLITALDANSTPGDDAPAVRAVDVIVKLLLISSTSAN